MSLDGIYHSIDPIAFSIGPISVRWYGLAYVAGLLLAGVVCYRVARRWKLDFTSEDALTMVLFCAFGVIIGARLGYCLFYGAGYYLENPAKIFALSDGGMSFHGGLIGVFAAAFLYSRVFKMPFLSVCDLGAIAAPVGLFFGRCANFVNGELWGSVTDLPWGVVFSDTGGGQLPRHPSQLYEALLEGVVLFVVLFALSRKSDPPRPRGTFFAVFLALYAVFRICIEFVRQPDSQIGYLFGTGWITQGMLLCLPMLAVGVVLLAVSRKRALPQSGRGKGGR